MTNTIADAIDQINAAADVDNTIQLRSTEGVHAVPAKATWAFAAGKNVTISAESGQPVVKVQWTGTAAGDMLAITAGTNAGGQTETITYNNLAFIPQKGLAYANNVADGIMISSGVHIFNNCVFSNNNGSDGVGSQEGAVAYVQSGASAGNVGDDWLEFNSFNNLTLSHCTFTGASDDAVVVAGSATVSTDTPVSTINVVNGCVFANNGGAAFQQAGPNRNVIMDGTAGRIIMAQNGKRTGAADTGPKFFWDKGCTVLMNKTDVVSNTNGGVFDFEGVPTITLTESRLAFNNSSNTTTAGNFAISDISSDSGATVQAISFNHVTVHDTKGAAQNKSIVAAAGATQPSQAYVISDSIFSGTGDAFDQMTNPANSLSSVVIANSAVVTAGPHAVGNTGELGTTMLGDDPVYASESFVIARGHGNPEFLRPTASSYQSAGTSGSVLRGGAPDVPAGVEDYMIY